MSVGSMSESVRVFDPKLLREVFAHLASQDRRGISGFGSLFVRGAPGAMAMTKGATVVVFKDAGASWAEAY